MSPTPSLRWDLPIYTVPDERNPVPVRCAIVWKDDSRWVRFCSGWFDITGDDYSWCSPSFAYREDGSAFPDILPRLQNLPEETA